MAIPLESQQDDEVTELAAALTGKSVEPAPPPPPPPPREPSLEEADLEPEIETASDPSSKTDRLDSAIEVVPPEEAEIPQRPSERPELPPAFEAPDETPARKPLPKIPLIGGGAGVAVIAAAVVLLVWKPWQGASPGGSPPPRPAAAPSVAPRPEPAEERPKPPPPPVPQRQSFSLSGQIAAVIDRAPVGTCAVFSLDLERAAEALSRLPGGAGDVLRQVAASKLWTDATKRINQGALPRTAALYLTGTAERAEAMFGKFRPVDPSGGPWTLAKADATLPHFLLRITGPAAAEYTGAVIARAKALDLAESFQAGTVATYARVRMVPASAAGMDRGGEMLLGTIETLDGAGRSNVSPELRRQLSGQLERVPTDRPILGCARLAVLRKQLAGATGLAQPPPAWQGQETVLVFSIDPQPVGRADLVVIGAEGGALRALESLAAPMAVAGENGDVRITGGGPGGLTALAKLLPGFQEVAAKALAMAPEPAAPIEPPKSVPPTQPAPPAEVKKLPALCFNPDCSTRGKMFDVPETDVSPDLRAGSVAMVCPHCQKRTATLAVKCPRCGKWYAQTLEACPDCSKAAK